MLQIGLTRDGEMRLLRIRQPTRIFRARLGQHARWWLIFGFSLQVLTSGTWAELPGLFSPRGLLPGIQRLHGESLSCSFRFRST